MRKKEWTGERLETHIFNDNTIEHLHRYAIAITLTKEKTVLDIACGEGYGSNLIAEVAKSVIGVDISEETVNLAAEKYKKTNLEFKIGSTSAIPLEDNSVDIVISFETIEHHDQHSEMINEIKRVLKKDGLLIISSPDKRNYTELTGNINPHHIKELYFEEFKMLLNGYFINTCFYLQKMINGSIVFPEKQDTSYSEFSGSYSCIEQLQNYHGIYNIAIAGDSDIPKLDTSIFISNNNEYDEIVNKIKQSYSYRIGNFILKPFTYFKKIFNA